MTAPSLPCVYGCPRPSHLYLGGRRCVVHAPGGVPAAIAAADSEVALQRLWREVGSADWLPEWTAAAKARIAELLAAGVSEIEGEEAA